MGPIAKASFEETPEMFLKAARHGELDEMRGVSSNVMCGQEGYFGTSSFTTYLDIDEMSKLTAQTLKLSDDKEEIDKLFEGVDQTDPCGKVNITIETNATNIKQIDVGAEDDEYDINL